MFKLLPLQILIAAVGAISGIISSYFASNYISIEAVSAIGIYFPISIILSTTTGILTAGTSLICGKYIGQNDQKKVSNIFSVDILIAVILGAIYTVIFIALATFDLTGFLAPDPKVREYLNPYMLGMTISYIPYFVGAQLSVFLPLENKAKWSFAGNVAYVVVNLILDIIFIKQMHMEAFGLSLAAGLADVAFFGVQAVPYLGGKSQMKLKLKDLDWSDGKAIVGFGAPSSATYLYQAARGYIVNILMMTFIGTAAISAFTAANTTMALFWSIDTGMITVSRMLIGIEIGAEDRKSLTDTMRVAFYRFIPLMSLISLILILLSEFFTKLYYNDSSEPVYNMTLRGMQLLPICMPFAIIFTHYVTYAQATGRKVFVYVMSALDGVVLVVGFAALLVPRIGIDGVYYANILNGAVGVLIILGYSCIKNKKIPTTMDEFMLIPEDFGYAENERIDITINNMEDVVNLSTRVQEFCSERGIDHRRSYIAGLALEEMAGNIVEHGFAEDNRKHTVDIRVAHKDDVIMLMLRDNCAPFDPSSKNNAIDPDDPVKNIGIRMVYELAKDVNSQNLLGLNALTIRI